MSKRKNIPGIIFTDTGISVSQIEKTAKGFRAVKAEHFEIPVSAGPNELAVHSEDFKQFLKTAGFKFSKAVVGISAKHVLGSEMDIPPLKDKSVLPGILKLGLEKKSMLSPDDILIDYSGTLNGSPNRIFVVSVLKNYVNSVKSFLQAANITPLSMTLRSLVCRPDDTSGLCCGVYLWGDSAEIIEYVAGQIKSVKYLPLRSVSGNNAEGYGRLAVEMQRIASSQTDDERLRAFVVGDRQGLVAGTVTQNENIEIIDYPSVDRVSDTDERLSLAGQLAWQWTSGSKSPIDFFDTHLNGKKQSNLKRIIPRITVAVIVVLALIGAFGYEWYMDSKDVKHLSGQLQLISNNVKSSKEVINRVSFARRWFDSQTDHIDGIRELTLLFPERGDVWLRSLAVDESLNQVITGKAVEERAALDILDKLEKSDFFTDVKLLYIRQTAKNTNTVSFAINFRYAGGQI